MNKENGLRSGYFSAKEKVLWSVSVSAIIISFFIFDSRNYLSLTASLIGVTSLIFAAKGNPFGQFLMIIFSILYGIIAHTFAYYGEMITYLGMTLPMSVFSLFSWMKNPYKGNKAEVRVNRLKGNEVIFMLILTFIITWIFYQILVFFHTASILPSTLSVTTSFLAVYLTFRRSAFYAVAYAVNDIVLVILWILAARSDISYLSVVVCFAAFFLNDIYGFIHWSKMQERQSLCD